MSENMAAWHCPVLQQTRVLMVSSKHNGPRSTVASETLTGAGVLMSPMHLSRRYIHITALKPKFSMLNKYQHITVTLTRRQLCYQVPRRLPLTGREWSSPASAAVSWVGNGAVSTAHACSVAQMKPCQLTDGSGAAPGGTAPRTLNTHLTLGPSHRAAPSLPPRHTLSLWLRHEEMQLEMLHSPPVGKKIHLKLDFTGIMT